MISHTQFSPGTARGLGGAGRPCQARPVPLAGRGAGSGPLGLLEFPSRQPGSPWPGPGGWGARAQVWLAVTQPPGAARHGGSTVRACQMPVGTALAGWTVRALSSHTKLG